MTREQVNGSVVKKDTHQDELGLVQFIIYKRIWPAFPLTKPTITIAQRFSTVSRILMRGCIFNG